MIKPIEILKPNILEDALLFDLQGEDILLNQGRKNTVSGGFRAVFEAPVKVSRMLIKNTDISNIQIDVKTSAEAADFTPFADFDLVKSGRDILLSFSAPAEACAFEFSFAGAESSENVFFYSFILTDSILLLDKALSSFTPSGYLRGGYHYTAGGTLITWKEFSKNSGSLVLENLPAALKQKLESLCDENVFLTFIFYGSYDLSQSGEYALTSPLKAELSRSGGLWTLRLEITEK